MVWKHWKHVSNGSYYGCCCYYYYVHHFLSSMKRKLKLFKYGRNRSNNLIQIHIYFPLYVCPPTIISVLFTILTLYLCFTISKQNVKHLLGLKIPIFAYPFFRKAIRKQGCNICKKITLIESSRVRFMECLDLWNIYWCLYKWDNLYFISYN